MAAPNATAVLRLIGHHVAVEGDCWVWTSSCRKDGYGQITFQQRHYAAHRLTYELMVGPIPQDKQLDHLCRIRRCVNPDHLQPVTQRENILRGASPAARHAQVKACPKGHPYTAENTYRKPSGKRECRECGRQRDRARYHARKAVA